MFHSFEDEIFSCLKSYSNRNKYKVRIITLLQIYNLKIRSAVKLSNCFCLKNNKLLIINLLLVDRLLCPIYLF